MRLTALRTTVVSIPVQRRMVSFVRETDRVINILLELTTDDDLTGMAYLAGFSRPKAAALIPLLEELAGALNGLELTSLGAAWDRMWAVGRLAGNSGLSAFALSAVDLALWDLLGKRAGLPVHRLLGSRRETLEVYASDGCWLDGDAGRTAAEAEDLAAAGFRAVKVRLGRPDPADDLAVVAAVRQALGDGVRLMVDVNQGWDLQRTLRYGARLAEHDVAWLEEPLPAHDVTGLAEARRRLSVPITAGESVYLPLGIRSLVEAGAVSVVMPDMQRVGGLSGWVQAEALADAWNLPITAHLFPEISVHALAAARTALMLEWVGWMVPLLREPLLPEGGLVRVPERPGLGLEFDPAAVRRFALD